MTTVGSPRAGAGGSANGGGDPLRSPTVFVDAWWTGTAGDVLLDGHRPPVPDGVR